MNTPPDPARRLLTRIRWLTAAFIVGLVVSGATAIPLETELDWLVTIFGAKGGAAGENPSFLVQWIVRVQTALQETNLKHPFVAYGADWLAFGHFVIALAFIGAWRDPVRNRWLFDWALIACALVIPYALVFGGIRGIPWWWRLIDCSFGIFGAIPVWFARRDAIRLDSITPG